MSGFRFAAAIDWRAFRDDYICWRPKLHGARARMRSSAHMPATRLHAQKKLAHAKPSVSRVKNIFSAWPSEINIR